MLQLVLDLHKLVIDRVIGSILFQKVQLAHLALIKLLLLRIGALLPLIFSTISPVWVLIHLLFHQVWPARYAGRLNFTNRTSAVLFCKKTERANVLLADEYKFTLVFRLFCAPAKSSLIWSRECGFSANFASLPSLPKNFFFALSLFLAFRHRHSTVLSLCPNKQTN